MDDFIAILIMTSAAAFGLGFYLGAFAFARARRKERESVRPPVREIESGRIPLAFRHDRRRGHDQ